MPQNNLFQKQTPTAKQRVFLELLDEFEALYGGAAGGGKTSCLLMAALMFVTEPGYNAIIFRRTFTDLNLPSCLIPRSKEWLYNTPAQWDGINHVWVFPSGARLAFGYLEHEGDEYRYQGAEFQFIGWDQIEQFSFDQYRYLLSRMRRLKNSSIPLRVRCTANPGGEPWVKQYFLAEGASEGRAFVPAKLRDNPHLDYATYVKALSCLDPVTRMQLLDGDWNVTAKGSKFQRGWFQIVDDYPRDAQIVRWWDRAATEPKKGKDPDWTAGSKVAMKDGRYYVLDLVHFQGSPKLNDDTIKQTAEIDELAVDVYMEQEPGSAGVDTIDHYSRVVLPGYSFHGVRSTGPKELYANPVASAAEAGNFFILRAPWNQEFLDEFEAFPQGPHDDIVDATSKAVNVLAISPPLGGGTADKVW